MVLSSSGGFLRISGIVTNFLLVLSLLPVLFCSTLPFYVLGVNYSVSGYHSYYVSYCGFCCFLWDSGMEQFWWLFGNQWDCDKLLTGSLIVAGFVLLHCSVFMS